MVSVVIPVYNGARYLAEAISSVLGQSIVALETIVVDDGSNDRSAEIAEGFGSGVRVIRRERGGPGSARNAGIRAAEGEFLAFLDADDLWLPGKLSRQLKVLSDRPEVDIVFTHVLNFHSPELSDAKRAAIVCPPEPMPGIHAGTMLVRRESFHKAGYFGENVLIGEFIPWLGRARDIGLQSVVLDEVLMQRRLHEFNLGRTARDHRRDYLTLLKEQLERRRSLVC